MCNSYGNNSFYGTESNCHTISAASSCEVYGKLTVEKEFCGRVRKCKVLKIKLVWGGGNIATLIPKFGNGGDC
jgi:hypothetical protein